MKCFSLFILNRWLSWDCSDPLLCPYLFSFFTRLARSEPSRLGKLKSNQFRFGIASWKFHRAIFHQLFIITRAKDVFDTLRVFSVCSLNNFIHYFFSSMKVSKIIFAVVPESCFRDDVPEFHNKPAEKKMIRPFVALICVCFAKVGNRTKNLGYY